jgi:hypothetical protein
MPPSARNLNNSVKLLLARRENPECVHFFVMIVGVKAGIVIDSR